MLRTALEQVTHGIVVRRRLPPPFGAALLYASSEGGLRYLRPSMGKVDPTLLRLAGELVKPGNVVWDIGANLGLFTFAASVAAGPGGRVLAVEPDTAMVRLLHRSAAANRSQALVDILPAAVTSELGVARFHIARRNRSTNYLDGFGTAQAGGIRATETVMTVTLEWLAAHFPPPDVIKIDVEEAEACVLAGGAGVLSKRPAVICEVAQRNADSVWKLLTDHGYLLYDGELPRGQRMPSVTAAPNTLAFSDARP